MKRAGIFYWLAALIVFVSCTTAKQAVYNPLQKLPAAALQQDVLLLKSILDKKHPSLYWYTTKDSLDVYFKATLASITDSLTELQFRNRLWWVINKIHCGHTSVRFSKAYTKYYTLKRLPQFPLAIKAWGDSLVVINNYLKDSILKRGTIITSINGRGNQILLDSMYALMGTDGYATIFKQQLLSFYFPNYYKSTFGADSTYNIGYIDSLGRRNNTVIKSYKPAPDSMDRGALVNGYTLTKRERKKAEQLSQRSLDIDTSSATATVTFNTFSNAQLRPFIKKSFHSIHKSNSKNVIIDLRQNSGGNIFSSIRLLQYLTSKKFKLADTVAAIDRSLAYHQYIKPSLLYWLSMHLTGRKRKDGRIHFTYFERHYFTPIQKNHFNGQIYLLTSGFTFSAASLVTSVLKGQQNVKVVGEETGGGSYGNTAVHLADVTLPNSGLRVVLPLYRMVYDRTRPKTGHGIYPDVLVPPTSASIKQGIDIKMEKVKAMIKDNK